MSLRQRLDQDMTDAERRIANAVFMGCVTELDAAKARVRVTAGDITTGWLPFATVRAGQDRTWHAPEPGEQVVVVCPCGDTNQGVVVGSVYRDAHPAPGDNENISRTVFKDGAILEYDRQQHKYLLDVPAGGAITLRIGQTTLVLRDNSAILTTPNLLVDSPSSKFTGHVEIAKGLSVYNQSSGATAEFVGAVNHRDGDYSQTNGSHVITGGDVTADGIGLKQHKHIEQGDGNVTSASVI